VGDFVTTQEVKRKLTAILSADVKGYSRLMGADEEGTLRILTAYREVMATLIQQHHGRVINAPGDALLVEEVIALDPKYPKSYVVLTQTHLWDILLGTTEFPDQSMAKATELTKKGLALDDSETSAHGMLGAM
jgi:hypothetical protein